MDSIWKKDFFLSNINFEQYELFSFDIFETLVFRKVRRSEDLHKKVHKKLYENNLLDIDIGAEYYQTLRMKMQSKALKKTFKEEITLKEIFDLFPIKNSNKEDIQKIEFEVDKENCYLNPVIYSLLKDLEKQNKKVILVSNMYYSKKQIVDLLDHLGLTKKYYDNIFVSSEYGVRKNKGRLFQHVLNENKNILNINILHIGDNYEADYLGARSLEINAIHYDINTVDFNNPADLEYLYYGDLNSEIYMLRKALGYQMESQRDVFYHTGMLILGPILSFYTQWIVKKLRNKETEITLPLMREGEILGKLLKKSIACTKDKIKVSPLYVSRKSTYIPALNSHTTVEEIINCFEKIYISIKDLFIMFEITYNLEIEYLNYTLFDLKNHDRLEYDKVIKYLMNGITQKKDYLLEDKRNLFSNYIQPIINGYKKISTVDVGFNGTIQKNIENALFDKDVSFEHFLLFAREGIVEKILDGMQISYMIQDDKGLLKDIVRSIDVFEQLLMGLSGSTVDYIMKNQKVSPVCEILEYSLEEIEARKSIIAGILDYHDIFLDTELSNMENCNLNNLVTIIHRLIQHPLKKEVINIGKLSFSTNFGSNEIKALISKEEVTAFKDDPTKLYGTLDKSYLNTKVCWPQGLLTILDKEYEITNISKSVNNNYIPKLKFLDNKYLLKERIAIYGAGEIGVQVIKTTKLLNLTPYCFVDKNQKMHGKNFYGVEVISLKSAYEEGIKIFIIASFSFTNEIIEDIKEIYGPLYSEVKIIRFDE